MSDRKRQRLARELQRRDGIKYTEALRRLTLNDAGGGDRIAEGVGRARAESSARLKFQPTQSHLHVADQLPATVARLLRGVGGRIKDSADARLRWEYAPGQREAQLDQMRREAGYEGPRAPESSGASGHDEVVIALGHFGTPWTLEPFDPDDPRWDREP